MSTDTDDTYVIEAPEILIKQSDEFIKQVITVLPGVHSAVGYGLSNSILIEGTDGNIIIDALDSRESAEEVKNEFDKISSKPIIAIIYTHSHPDHVAGTGAFAKDDTKIYSHEKLPEILGKTLNLVQIIQFYRTSKQFGEHLTKHTGHINCGIGAFLNSGPTKHRAYLPPTNTFNEKSHRLNIAGRELILYFAPGESEDEIVIHMPKENVLFAADNIYKSFPNIYSLRGATRNPSQWISSLDLMRNLHAEYLIPSHTKPLVGKDEIYQTLTCYRDAIQFVHDQTVRLMNKGLTPDDIIGDKLIQLPPKLKHHPYLQEFYGNVDWTIRAIFDRYLGWFNGKTSLLNPDAPKVHAQNLIELGGGTEQVYEKAQTAFQEEKYQWALELTEALTLHHEDLNLSELHELHSSILQKLASFQVSANGRNWYLTKALEVKGLIQWKPAAKQFAEMVQKASIKNCLKLLTTNFDHEKAGEENILIFLHFNHSNEKHSIEIRNSIVDIENSWNDKMTPDLIVEMKTEHVWKDMLLQTKTPMEALDNDEIFIKNQQEEDYPDGSLQLHQFLLLFSP